MLLLRGNMSMPRVMLKDNRGARRAADRDTGFKEACAHFIRVVRVIRGLESVLSVLSVA